MEGYCELANQSTEQLYKVSSLCLDDHHFKREELASVGELSKGNLMYFRTTFVHHLLDVQETNVSIPQFHRIRNHCVGCWIAKGWITCSRLVGCGDRSVTFIEEYRIANSTSGGKLFAKSQIQTQTRGNRDVDQLSHVDHVITNANFVLKASLSCTSLKTMNLWPKSLRPQVQRWDTCQEPTEWLLIGYLTKSTWTP